MTGPASLLQKGITQPLGAADFVPRRLTHSFCNKAILKNLWVTRPFGLLRNVTVVAIAIAGIAIIGAVLYAVSLIFNPLFLLIVIPVWLLYGLAKGRMMRRYKLKRYGYFASRSRQGECKYEEFVLGKLVDLRLRLENTEPGHWELFVPTKSEWRSTVPSWAANRRAEIIERIKPCLRKGDIHFRDNPEEP